MFDKETRKSVGTLTVDGQEVVVMEGDSVGTCLLRAGVMALRRSYSGGLRGLYCGMGVCHECLVTIDGIPNLRACVTPARPGCTIQTGNAPA